MLFKRGITVLFLFHKRFCSNKVRVRFAPSPTGYLHLGGLRTALYNYLFAKSKNGEFILRIEDTDQTRLVPGAMEKLENDLQWAGLKINEGPNSEGQYGPYLQSQRLNIYKEQVQILLDNGTAYQCFCTDKRLNLLRKEALRTRQVLKYDNRCRHLSKEDLEKRLKRGDKSCIRFKLLSNCETFEDLIYGNIAYDVALNEGDPVIMKADGYPTYHFANVVDDHLMDITHVLRGVEWQISTTKHILLYRAFNWEPPIFAHLPLLMNPDGTKLSKRQGDIQVTHYRESGIFPQALINFVVSCGGGFDHEQGLKPKCYSMDDLAEKFDINRINTHSTKLMFDRLSELNRLELMKYLNSDKKSKILIDEVQKMVQKKFPERVLDNSLLINDQYIKSILNWSTSRISKISDLISDELLFLWIMPSQNIALDKEQFVIIKALESRIEEGKIDFRKDNLKDFLKQFAIKHDIAFNHLMQILRSVLSGLKEGPGVAEMFEILGKENTLFRISQFIEKQNGEIQ